MIRRHPLSKSVQLRRGSDGVPLASMLSLNDADLDSESNVDDLIFEEDEKEVALVEQDGSSGIEGGCCSHLHHHFGFFLAILSAAMFTVASLIMKITAVGTFQIMLIRCLFMILCVIIEQIRTKTWPLGNLKLSKYLVCRGIFGVTNKLAVYYAILNMPMADAIVISFTAPAWTILFSLCLIREKPGILDIIVCFSMVGGAILVAQPDFIFHNSNEEMIKKYPNHFMASMAALVSAVFTSLALISLRRVSVHVHYTVPMLYFSAIGIMETLIVLSIPIMENFQHVKCNDDERYLIFIFSIIGSLGQVSTTFAAKNEKAYLIAVGRSSEIVFTFFMQLIFLNEVFSLLSVIGAGIIFCSILSITIKKHLAAVGMLCCEKC